jgi:hypothetical protein
MCREEKMSRGQRKKKKEKRKKKRKKKKADGRRHTYLTAASSPFPPNKTFRKQTETAEKNVGGRGPGRPVGWNRLWNRGRCVSLLEAEVQLFFLLFFFFFYFIPHGRAKNTVLQMEEATKVDLVISAILTMGSVAFA